MELDVRSEMTMSPLDRAEIGKLEVYHSDLLL